MFFHNISKVNTLHFQIGQDSYCKEFLEYDEQKLKQKKDCFRSLLKAIQSVLCFDEITK